MIRKLMADNRYFNESIENELSDKFDKYMGLASDIENYRELEQKIPSEIDYIKSIGEKVRSEILDLKSKDKLLRRNIAESIATLKSIADTSSSSLNSLDQIIDVDVFSLPEGELNDVQKKLSIAFSRLVESASGKHEDITKEQKGLIERLKCSADIQSVAQWKKENQESLSINANEERLNSLLAELELLGVSSGTNSELFRKISFAYSETSFSKQVLLIDSVIIEASQLAAYLRGIEELKQQLGTLKSQLAHFKGTSIEKVIENIDKAVMSKDSAILETVLRHAKDSLEAALQDQSVKAGRKALIEGLETLGYKVNERMQTALVRDGKLVVQKNPSSDYGVEVRGVTNSTQMQVRVVSHKEHSERGRSNDKAEEERWCSDFSKLKEMLSAQDIDLYYEKALESGEQAVKFSELLKEEALKSARHISETRQQYRDH